MRRIMLAAAAALVSTMAHGQDAETYRPTVPLMLPASDNGPQSIVRLINGSDYSGEVSITAVDDAGNVHDTITIQLEANERLQFNSRDLADGNANKGIDDGIGAPLQGNWRLSVRTLGLGEAVTVETLSYIRTQDGLLLPSHDVLPVIQDFDSQYLEAKTFNPASNTTQQSRLRLINWGAEGATLSIDAWDDGGTQHGPVSLTLPAGQSRTLTAVDLEEGAHGLTGSLGDGSGKWQLTVRGDVGSVVAQSLLYTSSGHISNLSSLGYFASKTIINVKSCDYTADHYSPSYVNKTHRVWTLGRAYVPTGERNLVEHDYWFWHYERMLRLRPNDHKGFCFRGHDPQNINAVFNTLVQLYVINIPSPGILTVDVDSHGLYGKDVLISDSARAESISGRKPHVFPLVPSFFSYGDGYIHRPHTTDWTGRVNVVYEVNPGPVFLSVSSTLDEQRLYRRYGYIRTADYSIRTRFKPSAGSGYDREGDSPAAATRLYPDSPRNGRHETWSDVDFYKFRVPPNHYFRTNTLYLSGLAPCTGHERWLFDDVGREPRYPWSCHEDSRNYYLVYFRRNNLLINPDGATTGGVRGWNQSCYADVRITLELHPCQP